jgi:hypothetical protein
VRVSGARNVRPDEPSSRASSLPSRASSLFSGSICATSRGRLGSILLDLNRAKPRAGSAWLDSTPIPEFRSSLLLVVIFDLPAAVQPPRNRLSPRFTDKATTSIQSSETTQPAHNTHQRSAGTTAQHAHKNEKRDTTPQTRATQRLDDVEM